VGLTIDGEHLVEYFAVDKMGNSEPINTATITIVDGVPGVVFQNSGANSDDGSITISFTVTSTAPIIKLEYSLDGGDFMIIDANATSVSLSGLEDGEHSLTIRAGDSSGNVLVNEADFTVGVSPRVEEPPLKADMMMLAIAGIVGVAAIGGIVFFGTKRRRG
jgi:large repetitive protein